MAFMADSRAASEPAEKPKDYAPARARWRRRLAFSLALRLLALIVLLDLLVCFISRLQSERIAIAASGR
jgi:hypothetical protein